jgi:hypothetical protein
MQLSIEGSFPVRARVVETALDGRHEAILGPEVPVPIPRQEATAEQAFQVIHVSGAFRLVPEIA